MIVGLRTMIVRNYDKVYTTRIIIVVDKSIVKVKRWKALATICEKLSSVFLLSFPSLCYKPSSN